MSRPFEGSYGGDGSKIADDTRLECGICWWVYDPALGDDETQTPPGTPFRLLPDTWECPNCAASKSKFMVIDSATLSEDDAVNNLANAYRRAALKVKGMPIYNPTLAIEAVGFREHEGRQVGVMVTPWFMNLTVLPSPADLAMWADGSSTRLAFPSGAYDFVVTDLHDVGPDRHVLAVLDDDGIHGPRGRAARCHLGGRCAVPAGAAAGTTLGIATAICSGAEPRQPARNLPAMHAP